MREAVKRLRKPSDRVSESKFISSGAGSAQVVMQPIPDFIETEMRVIISTCKKRYGEDVGLQLAVTEQRLDHSSSSMVDRPALFWEAQADQNPKRLATRRHAPLPHCNPLGPEGPQNHQPIVG